MFTKPWFQHRRRKVHALLRRESKVISAEEAKMIQDYITELENWGNNERLRADRLAQSYVQLVDSYNKLFDILEDLSKPLGTRLKEVFAEARKEVIGRLTGRICRCDDMAIDLVTLHDRMHLLP